MSDNILMWDVCETYTTYICVKKNEKYIIRNQSKKNTHIDDK